MDNRLPLIAVLLLGLASQPACFLKFWGGDEKAPEEIEYDIYGTVKEIDREKLVIEAKRGSTMEFDFIDSSIKGGDFGPGAYVHVYYKKRDGENQITMVVEKID